MFVGDPVVGVTRRIIAKPDHVAAAVRIISQDIGDLPFCEIPIAGADIFDRIRVCESEEGGRGCVAEGTP